MTIKQLKLDQFSLEERQEYTLVHDGTELGDDERLFDLLPPSQPAAMGSPKNTQYIVINVLSRQELDSMLSANEESPHQRKRPLNIYIHDTEEDSMQLDRADSPGEIGSPARKA